MIDPRTKQFLESLCFIIRGTAGDELIGPSLEAVAVIAQRIDARVKAGTFPAMSHDEFHGLCAAFSRKPGDCATTAHATSGQSYAIGAFAPYRFNGDVDGDVDGDMDGELFGWNPFRSAANLVKRAGRATGQFAASAALLPFQTAAQIARGAGGGLYRGIRPGGGGGGGGQPTDAPQGEGEEPESGEEAAGIVDELNRRHAAAGLLIGPE